MPSIPEINEAISIIARHMIEHEAGSMELHGAVSIERNGQVIETLRCPIFVTTDKAVAAALRQAMRSACGAPDAIEEYLPAAKRAEGAQS